MFGAFGRRPAGRRLSEEASRSQRRFLRANLGAVVGICVAGLVVVVAVSAVWPWAIAGPIVGGVVVGCVAVLLWVTTTFDGARHERDGARGERLTSDLFRQRSARAAGWRIVDSIPFDSSFGDVDHVAAGPTGVLAVETKWTGYPWRVEAGRLIGPLDRRPPLAGSRSGARKIRLYLKSKGLDVDVVPVLVVWGPGARSLPTRPEWVDSVLVVSGRVLAEIGCEGLELGGPAINPGLAERICGALQARVASAAVVSSR